MKKIYIIWFIILTLGCILNGVGIVSYPKLNCIINTIGASLILVSGVYLGSKVTAANDKELQDEVIELERELSYNKGWNDAVAASKRLVKKIREDAGDDEYKADGYAADFEVSLSAQKRKSNLSIKEKMEILNNMANK